MLWIATRLNSAASAKLPIENFDFRFLCLRNKRKGHGCVPPNDEGTHLLFGRRAQNRARFARVPQETCGSTVPAATPTFMLIPFAPNVPSVDASKEFPSGFPQEVAASIALAAAMANRLATQMRFIVLSRRSSAVVAMFVTTTGRNLAGSSPGVKRPAGSAPICPSSYRVLRHNRHRRPNNRTNAAPLRISVRISTSVAFRDY